MPTALRRTLAATSAILTALAVSAAAPPASASFSGTSGTVSTSKDTFLTSANLATIQPRECATCPPLAVKSASWSSDGSRAIFVDQSNRVMSVRWDQPQDLIVLATAPSLGVERDTPVYAGPFNDIVVWTEHDAISSTPYLVSLIPDGISTPQRLSYPDGAGYDHPHGTSRGGVLFRRTEGGTSWIYYWNGNLGGFSFGAVVNADYADLDPSGTKLVYTCGSTLCTADWTPGNAPANVQTIPDAAGINPWWSIDGTKIYYNNSIDVMQVAADGLSAPSTTGLLGWAGFLSTHQADMIRLAGSDRYATAIAVSQALWADAGESSTTRIPAEAVVLSRSDTFADALGGAALATAKHGPLLLTPTAKLDPGTKAEIQRILPSGSDVYLLGSAGAISDAVRQEIADMHMNPVRLAGPDRYETSLAIANAINPAPDLVLAATGVNFPDALSAGAAAGAFDAPSSSLSAVVILTADNKLPSATQQYFDSLPAATHLYGIGNQAADALDAGNYDYVRIAGRDRFETAASVAVSFFGLPSTVGMGTGVNWPDALSGGAMMGALGGPLLLTNGVTQPLPAPTARVLSLNSATLDLGLVFGSPGVVTDSQLGSCGTWIGGPGSYQVGSPARAGLRQSFLTRTPNKVRALR